MTPDGEFVDSSQRLSDPKYIQINEQEYAITRLVVGGYSRSEIEHAVDRVFHILNRAANVAGLPVILDDSLDAAQQPACTCGKQGVKVICGVCGGELPNQ